MSDANDMDLMQEYAYRNSESALAGLVHRHINLVYSVALRITGGKIMSSSTRDVKSRAATALRLAAQSLNKAQNYFGDLYRRWKARLGTPKAITAMAHKLARILWHLFKYRQPFDPDVFKKEEEKMQRKKLARLHNSAALLGLKLVPNQ
jgi:hypothetical protein